MDAVLWAVIIFGVVALAVRFWPADADQVGGFDDPNLENDFSDSAGYDPAHFVSKSLDEVQALGGAGY